MARHDHDHFPILTCTWVQFLYNLFLVNISYERKFDGTCVDGILLN